MDLSKADIVEIFSSYQGEGLFLGAKQIFIRFAGCNLDCLFCDTPKDAIRKDVTVQEIVGAMKKLNEELGLHHSVSLTGGEPLLHTDFLERLLPVIKKEGFKTYLETNGTLTEELKRIIGYIDIVAMDIKLPSAAETSPLWEKHIQFLKIARKKNIFIKVVVTNNTSRDDIIRARDVVESFDRNMIFVLQPASPTVKGNFTIERNKIMDYRELSEEKLKNVRVIPQVHKFMGMK